MEEEGITAAYGIILGAMSGATLWAVMLYVATLL